MNKVNKIISKKIREYSDELPHLSGGISNHGGCVGKQILEHHFPVEFEGQGSVTGGRLTHEFVQRILPSGMLLLNEDGEEEWLIIGHEQYVILHREGRFDRRSPIDTLVYNIKTNEYEVWDWKTTRVDITYMKEKPLSHKYELQANLYAVQLRWQWRLSYYPICRVIFLEKADLTETLEYTFRSNEELKEESIRKMDIVDWGKDNFEQIIESWFEIIDGMSVSSHTKNPYRYECRYCPYAPISERVLYQRDGKYGKKGEIKEGASVANGKCLEILNIACKKKFGRIFANFDEFLLFFNDYIEGLVNGKI
ncbi:MAG: PD-(D/E)XK nuclease family protein [Candidatus Helarchaeota archaeon]